MIDLNDIKKLKNRTIINSERYSDIRFYNVSIDSRNCNKKSLFFAIKGEKQNGHNFVFNIIQNVGGVIIENRWYKKLSKENKQKLNKCLIVLVNDTTKSLGELANIHRKKFIIPVLGIAGSNGKTTTKDLVASVLSNKYKVLKTEGNLNNQFGVPLTLFNLNSSYEFCVIELGTNHLGEVEYLCKIAEPQFGLITNIEKEHLEFLIDIKGVLKAEGELIDYLRDNYYTFFLNYEDKNLKRKIGKYPNIVTYGQNKLVQYKIRLKYYDKFFPVVELSSGLKTIKVKLSMIGKQAIDSAIAAYTVGMFFNVPVSKIIKTLESYLLATKRRNELKEKNGVWIIDDTYNSNPGSVEVALDNIKNINFSGKVHLVLSDMLELGKSSKIEHFKVGKLISKLGFENLYTFGKESFETYKGANKVKNNFFFDDKMTMIQFIKKVVKKGDLLFVKGSRLMKMEEVVDAI